MMQETMDRSAADALTREHLQTATVGDPMLAERANALFQGI